MGGQKYDLGSHLTIDGLFATISYRLEPDGRGSRFPIVMNRLYAGRLTPADAPAAEIELRDIESSLAQMPLERIVWSLSDLRRRDDSQLPVNRGAGNVRDYFVATDGRPLLAALNEAVQLGRARNEAVVLSSSEARKDKKMSLALLVLGVVWTAVGYLFLPDWVFTSAYDTKNTSGVLIWPAGIFIFAGGMAGLVGARAPALNEWLNRRVWLTTVLLLLGAGLYFVLAWRS